MKIKKVEIAAFRAFDNPQNSTFDFTTKENEIADFVSIYAPNGFGKTSFYDAVEWCITNQIERFHKNSSEYDKLAKENRKANSINSHILFHHGSKEKKGYVKIVTNKNNFSRDIPKSKVYDFKKKGEEIYFKEVILSQELIDSFIKEDRAEERYKRFVESFPNLNSYNIKLQNLIKLIDTNDVNIKTLKNQINEKSDTQLNIDFENDSKVLEEINKSISFVTKNDETIKSIDKNRFSGNDYKILSNKIQTKLISLPIEIDNLSSNMETINNIYNGNKDNDNNIGLLVYFDKKKKNGIIDVELNKLKKLSDIIFEVQKNEKSIEKLNRNKGILLKVKEEFPNYTTIDLLIKELLEKQEKEIEQLKEQSDKNKKLEDNKIELDLEIVEKKLELESVESKLEKAEQNKKSLIEINEKISNIRNKDELDNKLKQHSELIQNFEERIKELEYINTQFESDIHLITNNKDLKKLIEIVLDITEIDKKCESAHKQLTIFSEELLLQQKLNSEIEQLIKNGLDIVAKNKTATCPLCSHEHASYLELSENITNNKILDKVIQSYLKKEQN